MLPERRQQWHQRQSENGEVIAFDALEKLHTRGFKPVTAHASEQIVALCRQIGLKKRVAEITHPQRGDIRMPPDRSTVLRQHRCRYQQMGLAAQTAQLCCGILYRLGLAEQFTVTDQDLIGTE